MKKSNCNFQFQMKWREMNENVWGHIRLGKLGMFLDFKSCWHGQIWDFGLWLENTGLHKVCFVFLFHSDATSGAEEMNKKHNTMKHRQCPQQENKGRLYKTIISSFVFVDLELDVSCYLWNKVAWECLGTGCWGELQELQDGNQHEDAENW
jgi:hypothetical protein